MARLSGTGLIPSIMGPLLSDRSAVGKQHLSNLVSGWRRKFDVEAQVAFGNHHCSVHNRRGTSSRVEGSVQVRAKRDARDGEKNTRSGPRDVKPVPRSRATRWYWQYRIKIQLSPPFRPVMVSSYSQHDLPQVVQLGCDLPSYSRSLPIPGILAEAITWGETTRRTCRLRNVACD